MRLWDSLFNLRVATVPTWVWYYTNAPKPDKIPIELDDSWRLSMEDY